MHHISWTCGRFEWDESSSFKYFGTLQYFSFRIFIIFAFWINFWKSFFSWCRLTVLTVKMIVLRDILPIFSRLNYITFLLPIVYIYIVQYHLTISLRCYKPHPLVFFDFLAGLCSGPNFFLVWKYFSSLFWRLHFSCSEEQYCLLLCVASSEFHLVWSCSGLGDIRILVILRWHVTYTAILITTPPLVMIKYCVILQAYVVRSMVFIKTSFSFMPKH